MFDGCEIFVFSVIGLMFLLLVFITVFTLCNPCHPFVHNIRLGNYCGDCGEQLKTFCECGNEVSGREFCTACGLLVSEG